MKRVIIGLATILAAIIAQAHFIGLNGLTMLTIPTTIYLGFSAIDRLSFKPSKSQDHEQQDKNPATQTER